VFKKRVLRRIFGPKREEAVKSRVANSRRMRQAENVARMGEMRK
jgi:hypothetical protein